MRASTERTLSSFCRLAELGLEVTGQRLEPDRTVLTCRVVERSLLPPGAVADGSRGRGVELQSGNLLVTFGWWSDPNTYGVRFGLPAVPVDSPWTGLPVHSADEWASDVSGWLMEELQTGLVRRAGRREVAGVVELDPDQRRGWDITGYHVSMSGWVLPARGALALIAAGVGPVRSAQLLAGRRLISWLHAYVDNLTGSPTVGQAAVGWVTSSAGPARLDLLTIDSDVTTSVDRMLAHQAVHDAAEAGTTEVTTTLRVSWLLDVGFSPAQLDTP